MPFKKTKVEKLDECIDQSEYVTEYRREGCSNFKVLCHVKLEACLLILILRAESDASYGQLRTENDKAHRGAGI